jgi:hypothetical protein
MKLITVIFLSSLILFVGCSGDDPVSPGDEAPTFAGFTDTFDGSEIDPIRWTHGGMLTVSGGNLNVSRETPADFIESVDTFSGNWTINMDVKLNSIHWNDMFHGIKIANADGDGISFGFSMYDKVFLGIHEGTGSSSTYGPEGSNQAGTWQNWQISRVGDEVTLLIDGNEVVGINESRTLTDTVTIYLPGYDRDGDGGTPTGITSSTVGLFSITRD